MECQMNITPPARPRIKFTSLVNTAGKFCLVLTCLVLSSCTSYFSGGRDTLGDELKKQAIEDKAALQEITTKKEKNQSPNYLGLARQLTHDKYYEVALGQLNEAGKTDPHNPEISYLKGVCYRGKKEYQKAVGQFESALTTDPEFSYAHGGLGVTYDAMGRHDEARACYARAIEIDPGVAGFYNNFGVSCLIDGQPEKAIGYFKKSIGLDPKYARSINNLGIAYSMAGNEQKAIAAFKAANSEAAAYNNQGYVYHINNHIDKAMAMYDKAVQADPDFALAMENRKKAAAIAYKMKDPAASDSREVPDHNPSPALENQP